MIRMNPIGIGFKDYWGKGKEGQRNLVKKLFYKYVCHKYIRYLQRTAASFLVYDSTEKKESKGNYGRTGYKYSYNGDSMSACYSRCKIVL